METFFVLDSHSMMFSNPLKFMIFSWGNAKSSDNGQDIEYLLKIGRIWCKFNVFLTLCVKAWNDSTLVATKISLRTVSFPSVPGYGYGTAWYGWKRNLYGME